MQFSGQSENLDIVSEVDLLCDSNITSYPLLAKVRRYNASVNEVVGEVINADAAWQWDDTNYTDLPVGTSDLVEGQETYSFSEDYLQIESIEILDDDAEKYYRLKPLDIQERKLSPDEHFGVETGGAPKKGRPVWYDIQGDTVYLYPSPAAADVTLTAGLKVWFKRSHREITMSNSTTVQSGEETRNPPFPSTHHILLAYMIAIPYCMSYKKDRVGWLEKKVVEMKATLLSHYAYRDKDKRTKLSTRDISFR